MNRLGIIAPHSTGVRASGKFRHIKEIISYKKIYIEQPEVLKTFPCFKANEDEFVDYELLEDDVEQQSKAGWDAWKNYTYSVLPNTGFMNVSNSVKDLPESPLEVKRERFYAHCHANYSSPKGQWLDSKL